MLVKQRNQMHPEKQTARKVQKLKEWSTQSTSVSSQVHHTEAVFSIVRRIHGREPIGNWDTTLRAAVHLGQDPDANLHFVKNHLGNCVGQFFNEHEKLIGEQKEISGVRTINFKVFSWMSTSLLCSEAYQITNAKTYIFSDSVLCVGKMGDDPIATWKSRI